MSLTDNFDRANGDPGANWTDTHGAGCSIDTNLLKGDSPGDYAGTRYSGTPWSNDQSSQAVRADATEYMGVAVRMSAGANWYAYFSHAVIQECVNGGVPAEIANFGQDGGITNGSTGRLVVTGTLLEAFSNGISQGTIADASLASGAPGLMFYDAGRANDWVGTGESGGGPVNDARIVIRGAG